MQERIVLVIPPKISDACASLVDSFRQRHVGIEILPAGPTLAGEIQTLAAPGAPLVVLIPAELEQAVGAARMARRTAPEAILLFLAEPSAKPGLLRRLGLAPMLGRNWAVAEPEGGQVLDMIQELRRRAAKRASVQTTIQKAGKQLAQPRPRTETRFRREALAEEFLAGVLTNGFDAVICFGERAQVIVWNKAAEQVFGVREEAVAGRSAADLAATGVTAPLMEMAAEAFAAGAAGRREVRLPNAADAEVFVEAAVTLVQDPRGAVSGAVLIARDITARRRAEARIREEHEWLQTTLASIGDAVIATDPEGRVSFMNTVAETLTGWSQADAAGRPLREVFHIVNETSRAPVQSPVEVVLKTGRVVGLANHTVLIRRDGSETPIDDSAAPIRNAGGSLAGVVLVFRDIAERRAAERAVEQARDEAFEANKAKDRFLAVLSHELRTPLAPVLPLLDSLASRQQLPQDICSDLQLIRRNVLLEVRLIDDLLDVTRIAKGKLRLQIENVDIHRMLEYAADICRPAAAAKEVEVELACEAPRRLVCGDLARLQQVFWNLLQNAIKFTPSGGKVSVKTANPSQETIEVTVVDTGVGIEADVLPRIFDPFEQGAPTVTRRFGGLGLGLAICKALVEAHGGTISVASGGRNQGATFTVILHIAGPADCPTIPAPGRGGGSEAEALHILLVEDHEDTRGTLQRLLARKGHQVQTADSVKRALEVASEQKFDLLITDIGLPDASGTDLMRELRKRQPQLRGIALSGFGTEEDIRASLEAGFSEHLTKPVNFQRLQDAIYQQARP